MCYRELTSCRKKKKKQDETLPYQGILGIWMQGFRYSLCPLGLFRSVIEEESLFAKIKLLKTRKNVNLSQLNVYLNIIHLTKNSIPQDLSNKTLKRSEFFPVELMEHMSEVCEGYVEWLYE